MTEFHGLPEFRPQFTMRRVGHRWLVERHRLAGPGEFEVEQIVWYWRESKAELMCTALNLLARHEYWLTLIKKGKP